MYALLISVIMLVGPCLASSNPEQKTVDTVDLDIVQAIAGADFNSLIDAIRVAGLVRQSFRWNDAANGPGRKPNRNRNR
jgi:hypothetical protein